MIFFLFIGLLFLLMLWWKTFTSNYWQSKLGYQLILFIFPIFFGLTIIIILTKLFPLELVKENRFSLYAFSSFNLLLLIPQWYKLAWTKLIQARQKPWKEEKKLIFIVFYAIFMVFAIVLFFAIYYVWINSITNKKQGLLSALNNYFPIRLDFTTSFYFSFVTYFTLGYGDLVPCGLWMQLFVFLECLVSVLNTGVIAIYVYNFLFKNNDITFKKNSL